MPTLCYIVIIYPSNEAAFTTVELRGQHSGEIKDLRKTLSSQELVIESQKKEILQLKQALRGKANELATRDMEHRKTAEELSLVRKQLDRSNGAKFQPNKVYSISTDNKY